MRPSAAAQLELAEGENSGLVPQEVSRLEMGVGGQDAGGGFFAGALREVKARRQRAATLAGWHLRPHPRRDVPARQPQYRAHVSAGPVSRASFYRSLQSGIRSGGDGGARRDSTHRPGASPRYGYRRITAELRRRGLLVNHKRVARLMREDNLLAVQPRAFVTTTNAQHELEVYLNLASRLTLTGLNQLWVADITYIRLRTGIRLSGRDSRWLLAQRSWAGRWRRPWRRSCHWRPYIRPSRRASPAGGVVHHSDRGIQYAQGVCAGTPAAPDDPEHESAGESL